MPVTDCWDMTILEKMGSKARLENLHARDWVERLGSPAVPYAFQIAERHPALWWSRFMNRIETAIDARNPDAIAIGLQYILDDPKTPFGRIHKRRILRRLYRVRHLLPDHAQQGLQDVSDKFSCHPWKPQEYGDLVRLIAAIGKS